MTQPTGGPVCASCATANPAGARFCTECGAPLSVTCTSCGTPASGGRFCAECGSPLPGRTPAATAVAANGAPPVEGATGATGTADPAAPVSERRVASLLFADLVGFTPLSESRDPEAVRELLSAYFDRARAVVERYGGTVEKFIGDAVCAVFGVPVAREDDAERAVRAGLDLVSTVTALGEELRIEGLAMRVGITTGPVAVTLGAVGEGMVAGDAVNTAARVQAAAGPGEVWVDDTTRSLTSASMAYESTGSHELKGKSTAIELFRAVRTTAAVGGSQRVDGLEAPFVGRDRELRLVKELFHATGEERRARLVLVAGEPGIGKSRLSWEFEKYLDAITSSSTFWLRGRCVSYGQGVAGRVVAEMVRSLLRVSDEDPEVVAPALDARLEKHVADPAERDVLRPRLLSLLGCSDDVFPQGDLFACWRGFLEALCSSGSSVTLVIEDLQWADDGLLDFIDHLLDAANAPIMVLALARPEVSARRPGLGTGRRSTTVFLDPLPDAAMQRLLDGLVRDLPEKLRDELVRRAEGVPLYAVETVRSLIDRDVVVPVGGRYVISPDTLDTLDLAALAPPPTLHALLAARLDALNGDERRVVQDASVLGLSFTRSGLEHLTPSGTDLDAALDGLRRKEILTVDDDPRSPERGQLRFVQALLRGVAYETLSRRDRKARHLLVADYLEALPEAHALAGVVAQHCLDAAAAVPDEDVDDLEQRAVALLLRAAEHAVTVGAPLDAVQHYRRLLDLDPPDAVVLRACQAAADLTMRVARHLDEVGELIERGLAAAERAGMLDDPLALRLLISRSDLQWQLGDRTGGASRDALAIVETCRGRADRVDTLALAVRTVVLGQQITRNAALAQEVVLAALADVERFGSDEDFRLTLDAIAVWCGVAGYRRLGALVQRASATLVDPRDLSAPSGFANAASMSMYDDAPYAVEMAGRSGESARSLGVATVGADAFGVIGLLLLGDWAAARELLAARERTDALDWEAYVVAGQALMAWWADDSALMPALVEGLGAEVDPVVRSWILTTESVTTGMHGDLPAAARIAVDALMGMAEVDLGQEDMPLPLMLAVDMLIELDDRTGLQDLVDVLETLPAGRRYRMYTAQLLRARAHLAEDPLPELRRSIAVLDDMGARFWVEVARVELAEALIQAGQRPAASAALDQAASQLSEIGAGRVLRRVERLRTLIGASAS